MRKQTKKNFRAFFVWVAAPSAIFALYVVVTHFVVVSYSLINQKRASHLMAKSLVLESGQSVEGIQPVPFRMTETGQRLAAKAADYAEWSQQTNLEDGMVVDRRADGSATHQCDSLLFSSLRYVALQKLGHYELARAGWEAIQKSRHAERGWWRHPRCRDKALSRDMILGLMAAFSQNPPGSTDAIDLTRSDLWRFSGYISRGPFYVSFMSPGLRAAFDEIAHYQGQQGSQLGMSFWTTEFDALTTTGDYRSHLVALTLWLEMEIARQKAPGSRPSANVVDPLSTVIDPLIPGQLRELRQAWTARSLYIAEPENLFFRWLAWRTSGDTLSVQKRRAMAAQLMAMTAFPDDRLPADCDRRADYVWQRPGVQALEKRRECSITFSGTDFLWMAALLLDESGDGPSI
jgi:hypothetical protein